MPLTGVSKGRTGYLLFRVDDRLLHGQVALGWGRFLRPRHYLLADDRLAIDQFTAELYSQAAPEGTHVTVASLSMVAASEGVLPEPSQTVLLVRGIPDAARLLRSGVSGPVNLGGLHAREGALPVLTYLFLTEEDRKTLAVLLAEGHEFSVQDLPENPRHSLPALLRSGSAQA